MKINHALYPCLWFDGNAKEAAEIYCGVFEDSKITEENPMVVSFELNSTKFKGLNGGPNFKFNEAVPFAITNDKQNEIDYYCEKLCEGGNESMCDWLKD